MRSVADSTFVRTGVPRTKTPVCNAVANRVCSMIGVPRTNAPVVRLAANNVCSIIGVPRVGDATVRLLALSNFVSTGVSRNNAPVVRLVADKSCVIIGLPRTNAPVVSVEAVKVDPDADAAANAEPANAIEPYVANELIAICDGVAYGNVIIGVPNSRAPVVKVVAVN